MRTRMLRDRDRKKIDAIARMHRSILLPHLSWVIGSRESLTECVARWTGATVCTLSLDTPPKRSCGGDAEVQAGVVGRGWES